MDYYLKFYFWYVYPICFLSFIRIMCDRTFTVQINIFYVIHMGPGILHRTHVILFATKTNYIQITCLCMSSLSKILFPYFQPQIQTDTKRTSVEYMSIARDNYSMATICFGFIG